MRRFAGISSTKDSSPETGGNTGAPAAAWTSRTSVSRCARERSRSHLRIDSIPMARTEERRPTEPSVRTIEDRIEQLRKRKAALLDNARKDAVRKQHEKGKLTARERLDLLLDPGSFQETDPFAVHP